MSSRRGSNFSQVTASLQDLTNKLSAQLDESWNEALEQHLNIPLDASPAQVLKKVLSPESTIINTVPSFTAFYESMQGLAVGYRVIGFGQCGVIFEKPGKGFVIKVAKLAYDDALWADFRAHFFVSQAFKQLRPECRIPQVYSYVPREEGEWWELNSHLLKHDALRLPAMALIAERIPPLPRIARRALVNLYCPTSLQHAASSNATNRDCLARLYLGRRRPSNAPLPPNFTLRNYNLCLDQMLELQLPVLIYAAAMGEALAIIHWEANVDGYDIEFVLGSQKGDDIYSRDISTTIDLTKEQVVTMKPHTNIESMRRINFKQRTTRIWVLDFNLCSVWEEKTGWEAPDALIAQLVVAFFENDPYYPLPLMVQDVDRELWEKFSAEYLQKADEILSMPGKDKRLAELPRKFIDSCVSRERENLASGLGHGHRDHKD